MTLEEARAKYQSKFVIFNETSEELYVKLVYEENGIIMIELYPSVSIEKGKMAYTNFDISTIERDFSIQN